MKDPELSSPAEWAEDLRIAAIEANTQSEGGCMNARTLSVWDCRELADRMDDLEEALRLLRVWLGPEPWKQPLTDAANLLAKYETKED